MGLRVTIRQRGGVKHHTYIDALVRHCVRTIVGARMGNTLHVLVQMRKTGLGSKTHGKAFFRTHLDPSCKTYTIRIRRDDSLAKQSRTIAHEIKHLEQYARGRLRHGHKGRSGGRFWKPGPGRTKFYPYEGSGSLAYAKRPWEHEARAVEYVGTDYFRRGCITSKVG